MIAVQLGGGLGNQMFQYACGRRLSLVRKEPLYIDTLNFETRTGPYARVFGLSHFMIEARVADTEQARNLRKKSFIQRLGNAISYHIVKRHHIRFEPSILHLTDKTVYLEGYWQSEKYFSDVAHVIRAEFTLSKPLSSGGQSIAHAIEVANNPISLHVRRGDYVENEAAIRHYGQCSPAYYRAALAAIEEKRGSRGDIFVFSDDIEWVKKNLDLGQAAYYVSESAAPDYERMVLMSHCRDHIIANSTFSWWGAWLDSRPDKIVVGPTPWIPGIDLPVDDILPANWIRIPQNPHA